MLSSLCGINWIAMPATYDSFAKNYDLFFRPLEKLGLSKWRRETLSLLPQDASILEIGCGTGANFEFYPTCELAVSSDLSIEMLHVAHAKRRKNHLIQSDAQSLPFAENEFDAVFATLVFCSIPDPKKAFEEIRRTVKAGGKIILLEHVRPDGLLGPIFDLISKATVAVADDHFNRRTAETAERSGLKLLEVRKKLAGIVELIVCENPPATDRSGTGGLGYYSEQH